MFNLLPCPNSIRYSWFWSGPQGQTRVDSSLWPPGTVTKLPSGTSPQPPQNPKSPKSPKSKIPKNPKSKIQNPQNPKSQNSKSQNPKPSKSPQSKIQNPQNPKIPNPQNPKSKIPEIQNPNFFGRILGILDLGFWIIRKQFFTWGPQRPNFGFRRRILDFGDFRFLILGIWDFGFWGFWILDFGEFGFWILGPESQIQNPKSKLFWPNFLDFGFWILDRYVAILYVRPQRPIFWILAGILNFGFWKLGIQDFGLWGFWLLGFWGFWILDFGDFGFSGFWGFWILEFWNIM